MAAAVGKGVVDGSVELEVGEGRQLASVGRGGSGEVGAGLAGGRCPNDDVFGLLACGCESGTFFDEEAVDEDRYVDVVAVDPCDTESDELAAADSVELVGPRLDGPPPEAFLALLSSWIRPLASRARSNMLGLSLGLLRPPPPPTAAAKLVLLDLGGGSGGKLSGANGSWGGGRGRASTRGEEETERGW